MIENAGLIAIGRNEGTRLGRCLRSVVGRIPHVVYVDSGSTDGSVAFARSLGAEVVELDMSIPFTAARARNAGFEQLLRLAPEISYVQFVDGDCEIVVGWLEQAVEVLSQREDVAVVWGRRREKFPEASIYNRLCDMDWDALRSGETKLCGGDAMMRVAALRQAGGFNASLIAGEEPELCVRLRRGGGRILRIDAEMTLHDAGITRFSQWWRRAVRSGHGYTEGAHLHGRSPERHFMRQARSIAFWAAAPLCFAAVLAWPTRGLSLLSLLAYPLLWLRIYRNERKRGRAPADSRLNATFIVFGKFAQMQGMLLFHLNRLRGKRARLIEYKQCPASQRVT